MNNQKNRFWTFCLSLIPGAGEMYFGLYREGVSLMLAFLLLFIFPLTMELSAFVLLAVILWFYSFLHTHNLRNMPLEEFCQLEDRFFWEGVDLNFKWGKKYKDILAAALIVIGAYLLWDNLLSWVRWYLPDFLSNFMWRVPRIAIAVLIILLGAWLISGKKQQLEQDEQKAQEPVTTYTDIPVYRPEFGVEAPKAPGAQNDGPEPDTSPEEAVNEKEADGHADA